MLMTMQGEAVSQKVSVNLTEHGSFEFNTIFIGKQLSTVISGTVSSNVFLKFFFWINFRSLFMITEFSVESTLVSIVVKNLKNSDTVPVQSEHKLNCCLSVNLIFTGEGSISQFTGKLRRTYFDINNWALYVNFFCVCVCMCMCVRALPWCDCFIAKK